MRKSIVSVLRFSQFLGGDIPEHIQVSNGLPKWQGVLMPMSWKANRRGWRGCHPPEWFVHPVRRRGNASELEVP